MEYREIVREINKLNLIHRILIHRLAAKSDLYMGQFPLLEFVKNNNLCTQKDIADFLSTSQPSVATSVKRMEKNGLLKKVNDENDLRCNRISITKKGEEALSERREDFDELDKKMFKGFSQEELVKLNEFIVRLSNNLSDGEFKDRNFFSLLGEEHCLHEKLKERKEHNCD